MLLVQVNPALVAPLEVAWRAHFADNLTDLRRTPSGRVRRACDVLLDEAEPWDLEFALRHSRAETRVDERIAFFNAVGRQERFWQLDVNPVKELRVAIPRLMESTGGGTLLAHLAAELRALEQVVLPKPAALRRVLFPLLQAKFGHPPKSLGGGEYSCMLPGGTPPLDLWLDFGGRTRGVRWGVSVPSEILDRPYPLFSTYEAMLGLYGDEWDLLRSDRIEADMALLVARIEAVAALLWSVPWGDVPPARRSVQ